MRIYSMQDLQAQFCIGFCAIIVEVAYRMIYGYRLQGSVYRLVRSCND